MSIGQGVPIPQRAGDIARSYEPDVYVLAGGKNDVVETARVVAGLERTIETLRRLDPQATVVVLSPFASGHPTPRTAEQTEAFRQVADERGLSFVDVSRVLAGDPALIGADDTHPTDRGHERIAAYVADQLAKDTVLVD